MATIQAKTLAAVCQNKDIHHIIGEDDELWGPYKPVAKFITGYNIKHRAIPSLDLVNEQFPEAELEPVDGTTPFYVTQLKHEFVKKRISAIIEKADEALTTGMPSPKVLDNMHTALSKLGRFTTAVRDFDVTDAEAIEKHLERLREKSESNEGSPGIATGWEPIDICYPTGLAAGHSVILMGYTGRGKTMLADALAVNIWAQGYKVMIVSLEMSPEEQMERLIPMMSSGLFKISDMARGDINMDDFRTFSKNKLQDSAKLVVVSNAGISDVTPNLIQAKIDIHRPDVVILDYMQLFMDNAKTQAMTPRMLNLSREIKLLAMSNELPIVSITAVTDEDGDKRDAPPTLKQVAWSRGIEYDANMAIAVHRPDDSDMVEVVGRKNRHGALFDFYFNVEWDKGVWQVQYD